SEIRLLGAFSPNTVEGTTVGNASAAPPAMVARFKNSRRVKGCFIGDQNGRTRRMGKLDSRFVGENFWRNRYFEHFKLENANSYSHAAHWMRLLLWEGKQENVPLPHVALPRGAKLVR